MLLNNIILARFKMNVTTNLASSHENPEFKPFVEGLLKISGLNKRHIERFMDNDCMIEFTKAFTSKEFDPIHNYEFYEILGDCTTNKIVVWYFKRRFPEIFNKSGTGNMGPVAIMSRLKQVGVSRQTYAKYAGDLGFWKFIRATEDEKKSSRKLLEDTFEAFVGCLEMIIEERVIEHSGYGIVYEFMKTMIDKQHISLRREDLYDPMSLLNEEINKLKPKKFVIIVESEDKYKKKTEDLNRDNSKSRFKSKVIISCGIYYNQHVQNLIHNINNQLSLGYGPTKVESRQNAARQLMKSNFLNLLYKEIGLEISE